MAKKVSKKSLENEKDKKSNIGKKDKNINKGDGIIKDRKTVKKDAGKIQKAKKKKISKTKDSIIEKVKVRFKSITRGYTRDITGQKQTQHEMERFASFPKLNPNPVIEVDSSGNISFCNEATVNTLKKLELDIKDIDAFMPVDIDDILKSLKQKNKAEFRRLVNIKDRIFGEVVYITPEFDTVRIYAHDITERKKGEIELDKLNRTLKALGESSKAMMRAGSEQEYLKEVCRIIVEYCGHSMVWIGFAEDDENKTVHPVASAGFEEGYLDTIKITWADTERGRGPTGTAIRTGHPIICRNALTDPSFNPWRKEAIRRGYISSAAVPIMSGNKAIGAVNIYSREPDAFTDDEVKLLFELANDLSYSISSIRAKVLQSQAEEALRLSEERYRSLVEMSPNAIFINRDNRIVFANPTALQLFGATSADQVLGRTPFVFFETGYHATMRKRIQTLLDKGSIPLIETRVVRIDGSMRDVEVVGAYFDDSHGRAIQVVLRDITERKKMEEEISQATLSLRKERDFISAVLATSGAMVTVLDLKGRVVSFNKTCEQLTGYSFDEVKGKHFYDFLLIPEEVEPVRDVFNNLTAGQFPNKFENYWVSKNGSRHLISWSNTALLDDKGNVEFIIGTGIDITAQRTAEKALFNEQRKLINILDSIEDGVYIVNKYHDIEYINPALEKEYGHVNGRKCYEYFHDYNKICSWCKNEDVFKGKTVRWEWHSEKTNKTYDLIDTPMQNPDGSISKLEIFRDITERKCMEDEIRISRDELEREVQERTKEIREKADIIDSLFKSTITPLVLFDRDFNFIRVNKEYARVCSKKIDEFYGHNHFEFYPHEENESIFRNVVETRKPYQAIAKPFVFPDHPEWGVTYWDWNLTPLQDANGEVNFLIFSLNDVTERKKVEIAVIAERQRFFSVLDMLPSYVCLLTADYTFAYVNQEFIRRFGDPGSMRCHEYLFRRQEPCEGCQTYRIFSEKLKSQQWEWTGPDGNTYTIYNYLFTDIDGSSLILEMGVDITEFKKAVENLSVTNTLLDLYTKTTSRKEYVKSVVQVIHQWSGFRCVGIRVADDEGNIPYEAYTGFSNDFWKLENMLSLNKDMCACIRAVTGRYEPQDSSVLTPKGSFCINNSQAFANSLSTEELAKFRGNCIRTGFMSILLVPVRYRGQTIGLIHLADEREGMASLPFIQFLESISNMIGEAIHRFNTEESLRKSEASLTEAQRIAQVGNWEWEVDSGRMKWSNEVYRIFGLSPHQFTPTYDAFLGFVHQEDRESLEEAIKEAFYLKTPYAIDHRIVLPEGEEKIVHEQGEIVFDEKEIPLHIIGTIQDVTQIKSIENELRLSEERLRELYAHLHSIRETERAYIAREVHDEFGTILTALNIEISWLEKKLPAEEKSLREKTLKSLELINSAIKTVQKISSELRPGILDHLGLASAVEWQVNEFGNRTGLKRDLLIDVGKRSLDKELSTTIFRILQETLTNIARHAEATEIGVTLNEKDGRLVLEVKDNGKGITKEQLTDPHSYGLMGIKERIQHMNGDVIIKGTPNKGTTVTVSVPLNDKEVIE